MLIFIEDCTSDGTPLKNNFRNDRYNDRGIILDTVGTPRILLNEPATCEPGAYYTLNPMNPGGAFRIKFGQYEAWQIGNHKGQYPALIQCRDIEGFRDYNKDGQRTGDKQVKGNFGVNIHHGGGNKKIGRWSAGCAVFDEETDLDLACKLLMQYPQPNGLVTITFIAGDEFANWRDINNY
jgi:hypothetical protein